MKEILERIALKGTQNRREAIIEILEEYNIPYELQEIKRESKKYSRNYSYASSSFSYMNPPVYRPTFEDEEINSFLDKDFEDMTEEEQMNYEEQLDLMTLYSIYGMCTDFGPEEDLLDDDEVIAKATGEISEPEYEIETKYLYNIIIKPSKAFLESKNKILFSAHYDVVSNSTGANDNASSITILLKLIIELKLHEKDLPVGFVFFDGEETGGIGSKEYIKKYIDTKEKKKELTLVNLDVCGCGDYIVIVDNILNRSNYSTLLLSDEIFNKYNIVKAKSFPFSDASIFNWEDIGTLSVSVFPKEDVELLFEENNKKDVSSLKELNINLEDIKLSSLGKKHFGSYIWKYMHNGIYDDISYINYDMMELTLEYIKNCII